MIILGKKKYYIFLFFISLFLFINFTFSNDFLSLFSTFIMFFYILIVKREMLIPSMIFISFFSYLFVWYKFSIFVFICIAFIIRVTFVNNKKAILVFGFFLFYLYTHLSIINLNGIQMGRLIPFIVLACLPFSCCIYKKEQKILCFIYYLYGFFLSSILSFFKTWTRLGEFLNSDYLSIDSWRDTYRFSGLSYDANFYTLLVLFTLYILLFEFKNKKYNLLNTLFILATVILGLLTYSKSGILSIIFMFMLVVFSRENSAKKKVLRILPLMIVAFMVFSNQLGKILFNIFERFANISNFNELTSNRYDLWIIYTEKITESLSLLLFGHGLKTVEGLKASHNTYLEVLYKFGLIGFITDLLSFFFSYNLLFLQKKRSCWTIEVKGLWFIFLIAIFNLSAYTFYGLWACFFILFIVSADSRIERAKK